MKYLFPTLAIIFLSLVFSCKSAAPVPDSLSPAESDQSQVVKQEPAPESEAAPSADTAGDISESPDPVPEAEVPAAGDSASPADPVEEPAVPETAVPPPAPIEKEPEPQEPQLPALPSPPPPIPSFKMTPTPPPPVVPKVPVPKVQTPPPVPLISEEPDIEQPELSSLPRQDPEPPRQVPPPAPQPDPPPPVPREPPPPPSFLQPAEPEMPPPVRQPVPVPLTPLPELPSRTSPETAGEQVVFSRIVRATVGQMIEIPFRGTGWVYLGELGNRRGVSYDSRRLDLAAGEIEGQSFIFIAESAGTYILKFYKQDFIRDYIVNDYVQVIVGEMSEDSGSGRFGSVVDRGRVIAEPRWPPVAGSADDAQDSPVAAGASSSADASPDTGTPGSVPAPGENSAAVTQSSPVPVVTRPRQTTADDGIVPVVPPQAASSPASSVPPAEPAADAMQSGSSPEDLLKSNAGPAEYVRRARQEFNAGRVEQALTILDAMKQIYPSGTDEALWLYGQLLEANSPSRDIRLALEYYRRLVKEYPQSPRAADALRRIAYLERYYFNIR